MTERSQPDPQHETLPMNEADDIVWATAKARLRENLPKLMTDLSNFKPDKLDDAAIHVSLGEFERRVAEFEKYVEEREDQKNRELVLLYAIYVRGMRRLLEALSANVQYEKKSRIDATADSTRKNTEQVLGGGGNHYKGGDKQQLVAGTKPGSGNKPHVDPPHDESDNAGKKTAEGHVPPAAEHEAREQVAQTATQVPVTPTPAEHHDGVVQHAGTTDASGNTAPQGESAPPVATHVQAGQDTTHAHDTHSHRTRTPRIRPAAQTTPQNTTPKPFSVKAYAMTGSAPKHKEIKSEQAKAKLGAFFRKHRITGIWGAMMKNMIGGDTGLQKLMGHGGSSDHGHDGGGHGPDDHGHGGEHKGNDHGKKHDAKDAGHGKDADHAAHDKEASHGKDDKTHKKDDKIHTKDDKGHAEKTHDVAHGAHGKDDKAHADKGHKEAEKTPVKAVHGH